MRLAIEIKAQDQASFSRLGGAPELPPELEWPTCKGVALDFLAQFDLGEVSQSIEKSGLAETGLLYLFFAANREIYVDDGLSSLSGESEPNWRIIYHPHTKAKANLSLRLPSNGNETSYKSQYVTFNRVMSYPENEGNDLELNEDCDDFGQHRFFGYPLECNDGPLIGEFPDHEIFLQISSDYNTEMMWWDCGRLYFWIKNEDLLNMSFDQVKMSIRTY
jgi:uncharacterized protein YwqG